MSVPIRQNRYDVIVAGGGIAGLSAAWQCARHGLSVLVMEGAGLWGGQVATIGRVEGVPPGMPVSGPEFAAQLHASAAAAGVELVEMRADRIDPDHAGFVVRSGEGFFLSRALTLATGGVTRRLGLPGEAAFEGRGLAHCATCDAPLARGRDVVVVGGGDAALQEALVLAEHAASVTVVARSTPRARRAYLARAEATPNLRFVWDAEVIAMAGTGGLEQVTLRTPDGQQTLDCYALFPKIGCDPDAGIAADLVDRDAAGAVTVDDTMQTRTARLFAIGAVRSGYGGDLVDAIGDAARASRTIFETLRGSPR